MVKACGEAGEKRLESVFPQELFSAEVAKEVLGGGYNLHKLNFLERFMMKKISGSNENRFNLREDAVSHLAE